MAVPQGQYEDSGRRAQKQRTRQALLDATRRLMAGGAVPTVEEAAAEAGISRTTAYRYFGSQQELVLGAYPQVRQQSLLPHDAPTDPVERVELVLGSHLRSVLDWEPQLRAALWLSLDPRTPPGQQPLRQGRVIGWLEDALEPLSSTRPDVDVHRLAVALRAVAGIEALVWLTDVAGLDRKEAVAVMHRNARAVLRCALDG